MPLNFHPKTGAVLMCDFTTGFKPPEMTKRRPVVVISPRRRRSGRTCTVVPLSTAAPDPVLPFHHCMNPNSMPGSLANRRNWAKCDMATTVSLERLDRVFVGRSHGRRGYVAGMATPGDLEAIRRGVIYALGLADFRRNPK